MSPDLTSPAATQSCSPSANQSPKPSEPTESTLVSMRLTIAGTLIVDLSMSSKSTTFSALLPNGELKEIRFPCTPPSLTPQRLISSVKEYLYQLLSTSRGRVTQEELDLAASAIAALYGIQLSLNAVSPTPSDLTR